MIRHNLDIPASQSYEPLGKELHLVEAEGIGDTYREALIDARRRIDAELQALDS